MDNLTTFTPERIKYLTLLAKEFPTRQSVCTEIINLMAILNLPKGTEHFMSDLHGEYEAFLHIVNNCSGVIREKVDNLYKDTLSDEERMDLCTLIYYPHEKMELLDKEGKINSDWYRSTLKRLIQVARLVSGKYTRSKVRKAMPEEFAYIIDELLHAQPDEDNNQLVYHEKIIDTIIGIENADEFIIAISDLIKRLAVDHIHIVGDIYDRGPKADRIIELLMTMHSMDIEWGNHDILWMGAASGSEACIANVLRNNIRYNNTRILENGYGISLRPLTIYAEKHYTGTPMECAVKAVNVLVFKLEGQLIKRHPEYYMDDRLLLDKIDVASGTVKIAGKEVKLNQSEFPTVDIHDPYKLTDEEAEIVDDLKAAFTVSARLKRHIEFLYDKGSLYKIFNDNLLFHGCIPLDSNGEFQDVFMDGKAYKGKDYLDYADATARSAYFGPKSQRAIDFMWYLWGGRKSPLCGRDLKTFERTYIDDESFWKEQEDDYYRFCTHEETCRMILAEFGLYSDISHIINGHTPIKAGSGESPIKGGGKLIVIDGGFCRAYHNKTGIAGYTLIYNSHGMRIKAHQPFESIEKALEENADIMSSSDTFELEPFRVMVGNSDNGRSIADQISDLQSLLKAYRLGIMR